MKHFSKICRPKVFILTYFSQFFFRIKTTNTEKSNMPYRKKIKIFKIIQNLIFQIRSCSLPKIEEKKHRFLHIVGMKNKTKDVKLTCFRKKSYVFSEKVPNSMNFHCYRDNLFAINTCKYAEIIISTFQTV